MRRGNQRVHVAWPIEECLTAWEQLSAELRTQGFDVQPTGPRDSSFGEGLILEDMDKAVLSIHLLGAAYDPFSERVITLAADLDQQLIFWIATGADTSTDDRQRLLVDAIRRGVRPGSAQKLLPAGWTLLADTGVRRLIDAVITKLRPQAVAAKPAPATAASTATPTVYIVHDATTAEDTKVAQQLKELINAKEHMEIFISAPTCPASPS